MHHRKSHTVRTMKPPGHVTEALIQGTVEMNVANAHDILGNYDAAHVSYQRARSHFEEVGDLARLAELHFNRGMMLLSQGRPDDALRDFETISELGIRCAHKALHGYACLGKAYVSIRVNDLDMAMRFADQALDRFSLRDDRLWVAEVYRLKGMVWSQRKHYPFALWYLSTSRDVYSDAGNTLGRARCEYELGRLYTTRAMRSQAREAFRRSAQAFHEVGAVTEAARANSELRNRGNT